MSINMIKIAKLILTVVMLFNWNSVLANCLDKQINNLISQQFNHKVEDILITYLTPKPQLSCDTPILSLLNKKKPWGNMTIYVQCDNKKKFMRINVAVISNYVVAKQAISAGTVINEDHIHIQSGRLDKLPATIILNKADILNHIALRNIDHNEPIKTTMLQKNWLVKAGQQVKVIINGDGYEIATKGKALSNAVLNDKVKVKLNSDNIVEGTLTYQGVIIFNK
jgi:flagella basal body P-ring formation protein FlgA